MHQLLGESLNRNPSLILHGLDLNNNKELAIEEKVKESHSKRSKSRSNRRDSRLEALKNLYRGSQGSHYRMREQFINENLKKQRAIQRD